MGLALVLIGLTLGVKNRAAGEGVLDSRVVGRPRLLAFAMWSPAGGPKGELGKLLLAEDARVCFSSAFAISALVTEPVQGDGAVSGCSSLRENMERKAAPTEVDRLGRTSLFLGAWENKAIVSYYG